MTDRPRAFEYRGPGEYVEGIPFGEQVETGDHYVATFKMHPDDVELVCPVAVTAADVRRSMLASRHLVYTPRWSPAVAEFLTERLASRQATPEAKSDA